MDLREVILHFSFASVEKIKPQNINSEFSRLLLEQKFTVAAVFKPAMSHCVSHCHSLLPMAKQHIGNSETALRFTHEKCNTECLLFSSN